MPTYEYACRQCGEHLEVVQSFRDDPLTECPGCSGELRKVFSAAGLIFKGSGWHVTDYARSGSGSKKDRGGDASPTKESGSGSSDAAASSSSGSSSSGSSSSGSSTTKAAEKSA